MITWDFPQVFTQTVSVLADDIDMMQHTNNVVYLRWLEQIAWQHSRHLGLSESDYQRLGYGMVAKQHILDYVQPSFLHDELVLGTWIIANDRLSIRRAYQFVRVSDGATIFRGRTLWVCVDIASGKVRRMPAEFLTAYTSFLNIQEA